MHRFDNPINGLVGLKKGSQWLPRVHPEQMADHQFRVRALLLASLGSYPANDWNGNQRSSQYDQTNSSQVFPEGRRPENGKQWFFREVSINGTSDLLRGYLTIFGD